MYLHLLPLEITSEINRYSYYPLNDGSSTHHYFSMIRFLDNITLRIHRITNAQVDPAFTPIYLNDKLIFTSLPRDLNNYYTWAAMKLKPYLIKQGFTGMYKCIFMCGGEDQASIVINCDSNKEIDAMVFVL